MPSTGSAHSKDETVFNKLVVVPILVALLSGCAALAARYPSAAFAPWAPVSCASYDPGASPPLSGCTHAAETGGSATLVYTWCTGNVSCPPPQGDQPTWRVVFGDHRGSIDISMDEVRTHPN